MGKLKDFKKDSKNANKGTARGFEAIINSLKRSGAGRSIVVDKNGQIIGGNKTTEAAIQLFGNNAEVVVIETTGDKLIVHKRNDLDLSDNNSNNPARQLAYADNLSSWMSFDLDADQVMTDIEAGFDFEAIDIGLPDLGKLLDSNIADLMNGNNAGEDTEPQIDKAEELRVKWGVELGQLWRLGEHRLICGDCTDAEVVARVMGGEKFNLCATSPPYTDQRDYNIGEFNWLALANGFIDCVFEVAGENSNIIINLGLSHKSGRVDRYWDDWLNHCEKTHPLYGWYVWDKGSGMPGEWNGRLAPAHEFVFHFRVGKSKAEKWVETQGMAGPRSNGRFRGKDGTLRKEDSPNLFGQPFKIPDSVIRINRETKRGIHTQSHPAVFSVDFAEFFVKTWSQENEIICEPFSGSGTTMVAANNLGRRCFGIEIDPAYVAVTLERMNTLGVTPVLVKEPTG